MSGGFYGERRRRAAAARDEKAPPFPCLHCSTPATPGTKFCATHGAHYERLCADPRNPRGALEYSTRRTYWPAEVRS